jgi:hypothetical protein
MSDTKKFLDYDGLKYLWSKISLQDYPNNETLISVIQSIDETKADKAELDNYLLKSDYEGGGSSSGSATTEEWTFTLVDGSTVTKKVVIG